MSAPAPVLLMRVPIPALLQAEKRIASLYFSQRFDESKPTIVAAEISAMKVFLFAPERMP